MDVTTRSSFNYMTNRGFLFRCNTFMYGLHLYQYCPIDSTARASAVASSLADTVEHLLAIDQQPQPQPSFVSCLPQLEAEQGGCVLCGSTIGRWAKMCYCQREKAQITDCFNDQTIELETLTAMLLVEMTKRVASCCEIINQSINYQSLLFGCIRYRWFLCVRVYYVFRDDLLFVVYQYPTKWVFPTRLPIHLQHVVTRAFRHHRWASSCRSPSTLQSITLGYIIKQCLCNNNPKVFRGFDCSLLSSLPHSLSFILKPFLLPFKSAVMSPFVFF